MLGIFKFRGLVSGPGVLRNSRIGVPWLVLNPQPCCSFARHLGSGKWSSRMFMRAHHDTHSPVPNLLVSEISMIEDAGLFQKKGCLLPNFSGCEDWFRGLCQT